MIIECISENKISSYEDQRVTFGKRYNVLADYRNRSSFQKTPDNGLIILNDLNEIQMVFLDKFEITDSKINETYIFKRGLDNE